MRSSERSRRPVSAPPSWKQMRRLCPLRRRSSGASGCRKNRWERLVDDAALEGALHGRAAQHGLRLVVEQIEHGQWRAALKALLAGSPRLARSAFPRRGPTATRRYRISGTRASPAANGLRTLWGSERHGNHILPGASSNSL